MVSRRQIILGIGAGTLAAPLSTYAQQTERIWRLGWLDWSDKGRFSEVTGRAFVEGLRDAGFVEGRNLSIEKRVAFAGSLEGPAISKASGKPGIERFADAGAFDVDTGREVGLSARVLGLLRNAGPALPEQSGEAVDGFKFVAYRPSFPDIRATGCG